MTSAIRCLSKDEACVQGYFIVPGAVFGTLVGVIGFTWNSGF
jgi:hypothetical protein